MHECVIRALRPRRVDGVTADNIGPGASNLFIYRSEVAGSKPAARSSRMVGASLARQPVAKLRLHSSGVARSSRLASRAPRHSRWDDAGSTHGCYSVRSRAKRRLPTLSTLPSAGRT